MDLESELRKAMAEEVAGASAPPSLAADVRRRHRRRRTRVRAAAGTAAAAVAALALVPAYQSFRAAPAAAPGTSVTPGGAPAPRQPERRSSSDASATPLPKGSAEPDPGRRSPGVRPSERPGASGGHTALPGGTAVPLPPGWVTYLPGGLTAEAPCAVTSDPGRVTTTCTWRGASGWVEIAVARGGGFGPADLAPMAGAPRPASVRGAPALTGARPGSGRQIAWMARPGVGVRVAAGGGPVQDRLLRIAEGVRV